MIYGVELRVKSSFLVQITCRYNYLDNLYNVNKYLSMAQQDEELGLNKKWWNDANTKLLITEFKNYYKLWKNGRITKKKTMWQKVADALNNKGLVCTAEQVENRYKTLQRGYRRSCGIQSRARNCRRPFQYENELSKIFMQDISVIDENSLNEEESLEYIVDQESAEEDTQDNFNIFEKASTEEPAIHSGSFYTKRSIPRVKYKLPKENPAKTSVDVLTEIKELMKKVELRR